MNQRPEDDSRRITELLNGEPDRGRAFAELLPLIYGELQAIARNAMGKERAGHTLQATALVHEAWMRLAGDERMSWRGRGHFLGAAAESMRRVLVDHARKVKAEKRGGERARMDITLSHLPRADDPEALLALDEAFERLAAEDARAAEVARLRVFAGLAVEETARALEVSERTAAREWAFARARLAELLGDTEG